MNTSLLSNDHKKFDNLPSTELLNYECLSDHSKNVKNTGYFTKLLQEEDKKPAFKKDWQKKEEYKIATYGEMFENFNKSDNGSDWNISLGTSSLYKIKFNKHTIGDPFEAKDEGFPQPLPTSDVGSIFNKYGSGYIGECPPEKNELPKMFDEHNKDVEDAMPNIIKDMINLVHEDQEENRRSECLSLKNYEKSKLYTRFSNPLSIGDSSSQKQRFSLKRHSNPHEFKYTRHMYLNVPQDNPFSVWENAEIEEYESWNRDSGKLLIFPQYLSIYYRNENQESRYLLQWASLTIIQSYLRL